MCACRWQVLEEVDLLKVAESQIGGGAMYFLKGQSLTKTLTTTTPYPVTHQTLITTTPYQHHILRAHTVPVGGRE